MEKEATPQKSPPAQPAPGKMREPSIDSGRKTTTENTRKTFVAMSIRRWRRRASSREAVSALAAFSAATLGFSEVSSEPRASVRCGLGCRLRVTSMSCIRAAARMKRPHTIATGMEIGRWPMTRPPVVPLPSSASAMAEGDSSVDEQSHRGVGRTSRTVREIWELGFRGRTRSACRRERRRSAPAMCENRVPTTQASTPACSAARS